MALYHFTLKSDKKDSGAQVKAIEHVNYIDREGKYRDVDEKAKSFAENRITSLEKKDALDGSVISLYESPYGSIKNTPKGIAVTDSPSLETLGIALLVSRETLNAPLVLEGSDTFKEKCILAAADMEVPFVFADKKWDTLYRKQKEAKEDARKRFTDEGGRFSEPHRVAGQSDAKRSRVKLSEAPAASAVPRLRELPKLAVADGESAHAPVLLPGDQHDELGVGRPESDAVLRRSLHRRERRLDYERGRRRRREDAARSILKNIEGAMDNVYALSHVEYIDRENAFAKKGGCVYKSNRLPQWAKGSPNAFFRAADKYSPEKARRYQEFEFALQNELTLEQNVEIIEAFIQKVIPDHYYTYAVHDKIGVMSDGTHNLHVHLMFSPRTIDDVEKKKERGPKFYFKYPLKKTAKDQSFKARRERGAPMDRKMSHRNFLGEARVAYAEITNEILRKYGHSARIDHHSLAYQRKRAMAEGDAFLVKLLDRVPETHISRMGMLDVNNEDVKNLQKARVLKNRRFRLLVEEDNLKEELAEEERLEKEHALLLDAEELVSSEKYQESDPDEDSYIGEVRQIFLEAYKDFERKRLLVIGRSEAYESAEREYMTEDEREAFASFKEAQEARKEQETFLEEMKVRFQDSLASGDKETLAMFAYLESDLKEKEERELARKESLKEMEARLLHPDTKKQIDLIAHQTLKDNQGEKNALARSMQNLSVALETLRQALYMDEMSGSSREMYTAGDVAEILRKRVYGTEREVKKLEREVRDAKKRVITLERARKMAENSFVKGAYKKLRDDKRLLAKELERIKAAEKEIEEKKEACAALREDAKADPSLLEKLQAEELALHTLEENVAERESAAWERESALAKREEELNERISTPEAKAKIEEIAAAIVKDNRPYAGRYEVKSHQLAKARERLVKVKAEWEAVKKTARKDPKGRRHFKVQGSPGAKGKEPWQLDKPGIIAEALLGDEKMAQLVLTAKDDDKGMRSNWLLLTEAAKEEEMNKRFWQSI